MNTCSTCKHWMPIEPRHSVEHWTEQGLDVADFGVCALTENRFTDSLLRPRATLAWAVDGEDYFAALVANKNFGCVQHELRDATAVLETRTVVV